jgi:hypothetical protein
MRNEQRWIGLIALACLIVGGQWPIEMMKVEAAQKKSTKKDAKTETTKEVAKDAPMPFRVGEKLNYRVAWTTFSNAATVETSAVEQRDLYGWKTWHFRALIHTAGSVRSLFVIDDQADSYVDARTPETHQFEMYLDELGRKQNSVLRFVVPGQEQRGNGAAVIVQPGTRDPLAVIYTLRAVDWKQTPEVKTPMYDGRNLFELRAKMENASEKVTVAAGAFETTRVSIHLFQYGKQVADDNFVVWFAHDEARTPVAMQADLPFGSLHVEMVTAGK